MYVFDLDGTIADNAHRQHLVQRDVGKKDWDGFTKACVDDTPVDAIVRVMYSLREDGYQIAILSGRGMIAHEDTVKWLEKHNVPYDYLDMRPIGDHRDDRELKLEMMKNLEAKYPHKKVHAVFDDRKKVVDMWRENGYICFQVAPGTF